MISKLESESLFTNEKEIPLAANRRPKALDQIKGQKKILTPKFATLLQSDKWTGFIFWGPPGSGKTSLAHVISQMTSRKFFEVSAVLGTTKEIKEILERSKKEVEHGNKAYLLFIDEIHRLNKAQQDVLLPYLEHGWIRFIGATTENPSFEVNNAILSRSLVFRFESLNKEELEEILKMAAPEKTEIDAEVFSRIAAIANGDARKALNLLEQLLLTSENSKLNLSDLENISESQNLYYDKKSEEHYDTISAFIKSVRGSDPDAAIYYLARMLEGGEDPLFIARRLMILASEDIGNASPMGLVLATAAFQSVHAIGMPEARIILAQITTYLACAEKSNRSYEAINEAMAEIKKSGNLKIPFSIRNAPTAAMKNWGYGKEYQYAHNSESGHISMQFLPDELKDKTFYEPTQRGVEKSLSDYLDKTKRKK